MTKPSQPHRRIVCILSPGGFEHAGGIGRWVGYLCRAWSEIPGAPRLEMIDTRGFGGLWVGIAAFLGALNRLTWLWLSNRLGLIHINLSAGGSTIRKCIISMLAGCVAVPTVIQLHSGRFPAFYRGLPGWAKVLVRRMFARSARVIVLGDVWARFVVAELEVAPDNIIVLPNAVSKPRSRAAKPARADCHIVMLGRLGPLKGLPELLEALATPEMRELNWRTTLAGDGDQAPWRAQAQATGIAERVTMPGWVDGAGAAALLEDADIFVLPSHSENMPVSLIEACAYGVAVVVTPVGAVPEIVEDGVSALIVPVQNQAALSAALASLVVDPALRARIAAGGHAVFLEKLDIRNSAAKLARLYDDLIPENQRQVLAT